MDLDICIAEVCVLGFRAHQESWDLLDNLEIKALQVRLAFLGLKDPVVTLVLR